MARLSTGSGFPDVVATGIAMPTVVATDADRLDTLSGIRIDANGYP